MKQIKIWRPALFPGHYLRPHSCVFAALGALFGSPFVVLFVPTQQMFSSSVVCVGLPEQETAGADGFCLSLPLLVWFW